jgi:hypothetical protein
MKLIGLKIEGVRKIRCAELAFEGSSLIEVRGKNGAGKSSVIDSILMMFNGSSAIPKDVVNHGMDKATIIGKVGAYEIKRTIKPDGTSTVMVSSPDGKIAQPQKFLDELAGQFIDPKWFSDLPSMDKRKTVMQKSGLDFTEIDRKIADAEQERLVIGRELRNLGIIPKEPEKEISVSVSELLLELEKINRYNSEQDSIAFSNQKAIEDMKRPVIECFSNAGTISEIHKAILTAESTLKTFETSSILQKVLAKKSSADIQQKISNAEEINKKAALYTNYLAKKKQVEDKQKEYDSADGKLKSLRNEKDDMVLNAKLPLKGLIITDTGLSFNGVTDSNWSDSEQIKIAICLASAWCGEVKAVYIKGGEAFDSSSLQKIKKMADEQNLQIIIEIVDDSYSKNGDGVIQIEEGEVINK